MGTRAQLPPFLPVSVRVVYAGVVCVAIFPAALDIEHLLLGFLSFRASVVSVLLMPIFDFPLIVFNTLPATGMQLARGHPQPGDN